MPRTHERKTRPARLNPMAATDIPAWALEVPPPPGIELAVLFNMARYRPALAEVGAYAAYFAALAARAQQEFEKGKGALLELLDLAPGLISERLQPWILDGLRTLFAERAYYAFSPLIKKVGKIGSDRDLARARAVHDMQFDFMPPADFKPGNLRPSSVSPFAPSGISQEEAIRRLAAAEQTTEEAIRKSLRRAKAKSASIGLPPLIRPKKPSAPGINRAKPKV
jgi:hypothetical protein